MFESQVLGAVGTVLVVVAYIPQVVHLLRERCSAGISLKAHALWLAASVLFLVHAVEIRDLAFMLVQVVNVAAIVAIVVVARRYRGLTCASHATTGAGPSHASAPSVLGRSRPAARR